MTLKKRKAKTKRNRFRCPICLQIFYSVENASKHAKENKHWGDYNTVPKPIQVVGAADYQEIHNSKRKPGGQPCLCPKCGYEWVSRKEKPKACPYCKQYLPRE